MTAMTTLPDTALRQIVTFHIDPAATRELARAHFERTVARLRHEHGLPPDFTGPARAHPRVSWAARKGQTEAQKSLSLARLDAPAMGLEHVPGPSVEHWCQASVDMLQDDIQRVDPAQSLTLSRGLRDRTRHLVMGAANTLQRVWPEASAEVGLLVQAIVYVDSQVFRSATMQQTFGAVYASAESLTSVAAAFEMLLHETGHHSLYLRNGFERFVTNGSELSVHPLRQDPRPISGVVHSGHVLARMATGLDRWCQAGDVPDEVVMRRDIAVQRLAQTMEILAGKARWTDRGREYFTELVRVNDSLCQPAAAPA